MARVLVVDATGGGHGSAVAGRVASLLRSWGHLVDLLDEAETVDAFDVGGVEGVVLATAPRLGRHARSVSRFVAENQALLHAAPAALLAVDVRLAWKGRWYREAAQRSLDAFLRGLGWTPGGVLLVAGAVEYTRQGRLRRALTRRLVAPGGGATDTSRDHVFTDWNAVDRFAAAFDVSLAGGREAARPVVPRRQRILVRLP